MNALKETIMVLSMRLYVCWAQGVFSLVGWMADDTAGAHEGLLALGRTVRLWGHYLFNHPRSMVAEAYDAARARMKELQDAD